VTVYRLPRSILDDSFCHFRQCGAGCRECLTLWVGPWVTPGVVTKVVHPQHAASLGSFIVDDDWLSNFWLWLADENLGIRLQVHTHPTVAFHSPIDDEHPIIRSPGFLSLVIPDFAFGPVGFDGAYLTEIQPDGRWKQVSITERLLLA
jgi:hypothetical protein